MSLCPLNSKGTAYKACAVLSSEAGSSQAGHRMGETPLLQVMSPITLRGLRLHRVLEEDCLLRAGQQCLLLGPLASPAPPPSPLGSGSHSVRNVLESMDFERPLHKLKRK